jgi:PIN domain nuclease of toxin-antitoxin system
MRLLLDSHAFLWLVTDDAKLSARARGAVAGASEVLLSLVSVWEMTIKRSLGRLHLVEAPEAMAVKSRVPLLPIELRHIQLSAGLPRHHGDPFDRLLAAQAIQEGMVLVTADRVLQRYPVAWLW